MYNEAWGLVNTTVRASLRREILPPNLHINLLRPYFKVTIIFTVLLCSTGWNWPWSYYSEREKEQIIHFKKSHELFLEASALRRKFYGPDDTSPIGFGTITDKDQQLYINTLENAFFYGKKVSTSVLSKIHPDLPDAYNNIYLPSLSNQSESIKESNVKKQIIGVELHNMWVEWFNAHVNDFKLQ